MATEKQVAEEIVSSAKARQELFGGKELPVEHAIEYSAQRGEAVAGLIDEGLQEAAVVREVDPADAGIPSSDALKRSLAARAAIGQSPTKQNLDNLLAKRTAALEEVGIADPEVVQQNRDAGSQGLS